MAVERERAISVSAVVMSFEHDGLAFNLLDTPGHQDFQRGHLPHADRGRHRGDGARRHQGHRAITYVNKLDREGRDPFGLLDEIEQSLALDVTSASWPIGVGRDFLGPYDLVADGRLLVRA